MSSNILIKSKYYNTLNVTNFSAGSGIENKKDYQPQFKIS